MGCGGLQVTTAERKRKKKHCASRPLHRLRANESVHARSGQRSSPPAQQPGSRPRREPSVPSVRRPCSDGAAHARPQDRSDRTAAVIPPTAVCGDRPTASMNSRERPSWAAQALRRETRLFIEGHSRPGPSAHIAPDAGGHAKRSSEAKEHAALRVEKLLRLRLVWEPK